MVKVLHVFSYFRPDFTGEGVYYEKIRDHFAANGVENDVLAVQTCLRNTDAPAASATYLGMLNKGAIAVSLRLAIWLIWHAHQFNTIHFHAFADRHFAGHLVCKLFGRRTLQSCTLDDSPHTIINTYRPLWRWLIRWLIRLPDNYITISPRLYDSAVTVLPRKKVQLLPQGVEVPELAPLNRDEERTKRGYNPDDKILLFVGGICERKGVDLLIKAMPALLQHSKNLRLLIVGPDLEDEYAARVRKQVDELKLQQHVEFAGPLDDVSPVYRISDMLVFASHLEGFGNVLLEAMAHELPVVSRRLPGVTDSFISHGETGLLFDNEEEYIEAAKKLIDDPGYSHRIGQAARQAVSKDYEMSAIASRYVELYTGQVSAYDD